MLCKDTFRHTSSILCLSGFLFYDNPIAHVKPVHTSLNAKDGRDERGFKDGPVRFETVIYFLWKHIPDDMAYIAFLFHCSLMECVKPVTCKDCHYVFSEEIPYAVVIRRVIVVYELVKELTSKISQKDVG